MMANKKSLVNRINEIRKNIAEIKIIPLWFSLAGIIVYFLTAIKFAHTKLSFLDEGLLLFKGYLFANGQFTPYADFGVRTNQLPLAFLIPGYIQEWFEPGLQTGRYFSIFLSILFLVGLWLTVRKLSGSWWATAAVWAYVLNPAAIKIYTIAISQGSIACMFIWLLYFSLNEKQEIWKTIIAGFLTAVMVLTRLNMIIVLPCFAIYFWWRHGIKQGVVYLISGSALLIVGHALFWPGILQVWAGWLPKSITPFLDPWRKNSGGVLLQYLIPTKAEPFTERFTNFWLVIRLHFAGIFGAISAVLLFPGKKAWQEEWKYKIAIFLTGTFFILFVFHLYVTFGMDYCVSCIILYTSFFDFTGIIALILVITTLSWNYSIWRKVIMAIVMIVTAIGILYTSIENFIQPILHGGDSVLLLGRGLFSGIIKFVQNILNLRYYPAIKLVAFIAIIVVLLILILLYFAFFHKKFMSSGYKLDPSRLVVIFLIIGFVLSPTRLLGSGNDFFDCNGDVIRAYEDAGTSMMKEIPAGSTVFWEGRSSAIFLYLPGIKFYPPQLNHIHSYFQGGDDLQLLKFGRYNEHLASMWFGEADFILVEQAWVKKWQTETLTSGSFELVGTPHQLGQCKDAGELRLYRRIK